MHGADNTASKQRGVPFEPGKSGNPNGRPLGARNKLGSAFVEAMQEDFSEHGKAVIATVRADRPHEYLKVVASLLPKELHVKDASLDDMTDDEVVNVLAAVRSLIAGKASGQAGSGTDETNEPGASRH